MTDLLDAVDALTLPAKTKVVQWFTDEKGKEHSHTTTIRHDALIDQLETAVVSSMSGRAGGGNPATRAVLNSDAMYQASLIRSQITDWCRIEHVTPSHVTGRDLRAWYAARLSRTTDDQFYLTQLRKWEGTIRVLLDPPRQIEVTAACVVCNAILWTDPEGTEHPYPVIIQYKEGEPDILADAKAICRACETVWRGSSALRELRFEIDERDSA